MAVTGRRPSPAVFLDKDGTLVENVPYNVDPGKIRLVPGAIESLSALHAAGYRLIVISNQSGVARGYFPEAALIGVESHLRGILAKAAVPLTGFYYCPHLPSGTTRPYAVECACRKPQPGMLIRAAQDHQIELNASWLIGDILDDVEAGRRAGCRAILVDNGGETEWKLSPARQPHHIAPNLPAAVNLILTQSSSISTHQTSDHGLWTLDTSGVRL